MFDLAKIIGLTVVAIKGEDNSKGKYIEPVYILFSDGETYIELSEQDYYAYHDCASSARHISIFSNSEVWSIINTYPDATTNI